MNKEFIEIQLSFLYGFYESIESEIIENEYDKETDSLLEKGYISKKEAEYVATKIDWKKFCDVYATAVVDVINELIECDTGIKDCYVFIPEHRNYTTDVINVKVSIKNFNKIKEKVKINNNSEYNLNDSEICKELLFSVYENSHITQENIIWRIQDKLNSDKRMVVAINKEITEKIINERNKNETN